MKRTPEKPKMYIIRKYVKATDVKDAIKKEPSTPVHDLWIDESWQKDNLPDAIGFGQE